MPVRTGFAVGEGDLLNGKGTVKLGSGAFEGRYSFASRFEEGNGTNPEELIGAAHAGCFSMALSHELAQAGHTPKRVSTTAKVHLEKVAEGFKITSIDLNTEAEIPGIGQDEFQKFAENAKKGCPVSQALSSGIVVNLLAKLIV